MEVVLSPSVVYFFEAHVMCEEKLLEEHFARYGQVFRCAHLTEPNGLNKTYGFVDFVSTQSAEKAVEMRSQLLHPGEQQRHANTNAAYLHLFLPVDTGQYVHVSRFLPQSSLYDLFAVSDKRGAEIARKLERAVPEEGSWGRRNPVTGMPRGWRLITSLLVRLISILLTPVAHTGVVEAGTTAAKVRIPANMVSKLIGERGKTIAEISRDSKTRLFIINI